jgi:hypothetical protein
VQDIGMCGLDRSPRRGGIGFKPTPMGQTSVCGVCGSGLVGDGGVDGRRLDESGYRDVVVHRIEIVIGGFVRVEDDGVPLVEGREMVNSDLGERE